MMAYYHHLLLLHWLKEGGFFPIAPMRVFFRSTLITLTFLFGSFVIVYIGASVQPETSFSDIRTIVVVIMTIIIPYILITNEIQITVNKQSLIALALLILMFFASSRTFYETYPKTIDDPINVIEDDRLDKIELLYTRDFIENHFFKADFAYDFKSHLYIPHYLFYQDFSSYLITRNYPPANRLIIYDIHGMEVPSLHTSIDFYRTALSYTNQTDVRYNNGSILIQGTR